MSNNDYSVEVEFYTEHITYVNIYDGCVRIERAAYDAPTMWDAFVIALTLASVVAK